MSEITVNARDGGAFGAYIAMPRQTPAPGVVLLQEVYGVNRFMQRIADHWAEQGFVAVAPHVYWRIAPGVVLDPEVSGARDEARALGQRLDVDQAVKDVDDVVAHLRAVPECTGKVATSGYCLGGKLAYLNAARGTADCNVSYYGVGIENVLDEAPNIGTPLMLHMGEADPWTPLAVRKRIEGVLAGFMHVSIYHYPDTDHAFAREGASSDVPEMRELANRRTRDFFRRHLN